MWNLRRLVKAICWILTGNPIQRRRVRHEFARQVAGLFGDYYVGDDYKVWRQDKSFIKKFRDLSPHNFFSEERKFVLREFARFAKNIKGDIAECGSYVGVSAWFMASENKQVDFFVFDAFEGLSKASEKDLFPDGTAYWKEGDFAVTEKALIKNLSEFDRIHVLKGWIPSRFNEVSDRTFRLVHIDVDLYQPTLDSLCFFYPRLAPGGVIVMDDYGFTNCPGAKLAADEFMADKPEYILHLPTGQGIIIRQKGDTNHSI
jgi:O-methyltransferase